ncbi:MAG TPA: tRNA lysidine(34) synthetase TilS, partial [Arenimonas sp.]|nr:tRNA lysidine(34) synthetase TilS [Arenimonas sp.]
MDAAAPWLSALREAAREHAPLLVAYSGGLDSSVLLHALANEPATRARGLRAIHVEHGLHADARQWADHCARNCERLGVTLIRHRADVRPDGEGLEAAARNARYIAFAEALQPGETLVLAQHRDDQAETVLLRLLRGAGGHGLSGMPVHRDIAEARLWRPLLDIGRDALDHYAQTHALTWVEDPSNRETRFDRNFLRAEVMPLLRQRWPKACESLARSAQWLAEESLLLEEAAAERLARVQGIDPDTLSIDALTALAPGWQKQVLRLWLARHAHPPLPAHAFTELLGPLLAARDDAVPELRWSGSVLRRWSGRLWLAQQQPDWPAAWHCDWNGCGVITVPDGRSFALDRPEPTPI